MSIWNLFLASSDVDFFANSIRAVFRKETVEKLHVFQHDKAEYFAALKNILSEKQLKAFSIGGEGNGKAPKSSGMSNGMPINFG